MWSSSFVLSQLMRLADLLRQRFVTFVDRPGWKKAFVAGLVLGAVAVWIWPVALTLFLVFVPMITIGIKMLADGWQNPERFRLFSMYVPSEQEVLGSMRLIAVLASPVLGGVLFLFARQMVKGPGS